MCCFRFSLLLIAFRSYNTPYSIVNSYVVDLFQVDFSRNHPESPAQDDGETEDDVDVMGLEEENVANEEVEEASLRVPKGSSAQFT